MRNLLLQLVPCRLTLFCDKMTAWTRDQDHTSGTRTTHQGPGPHIRDQDHTSGTRTTHQGPGPHIRDQDHTSGTRHHASGTRDQAPHIRDQNHTSGTRTTHQGPGPHIACVGVGRWGGVRGGYGTPFQFNDNDTSV